MSNDQHTRKPGHTPGPWIPWETPMIRQGIYYKCPIESAHPDGIINVAIAFGVTQEECKANARIIADSITIAEELERLKAENEKLRGALKKIYGMAEDGYTLHKRNGSHQEFLHEDREALHEAKTALEP